MASVVTINRPDVVARIEALANWLTGETRPRSSPWRFAASRSGSLFGASLGSVAVREGVDLTAPILDDPMDAEIGPVP